MARRRTRSAAAPVPEPPPPTYAEMAAEVLRDLPAYADEQAVEIPAGALRVLLAVCAAEYARLLGAGAGPIDTCPTIMGDDDGPC